METDHGFVPDDLVLLVDFLNSTYPGMDDDLSTAAQFAAWLGAHGRSGPVTAEQLQTARDLRAGLRAATIENAGVSADAAELAAGERALALTPLRVSLRDHASTILAIGTGADALLGQIAATFAAARITGRWPRVKGCTGEDCGFVFWDDSRNASRRWCDMQRCGSRQKMRNYRARAVPGHPGAPDHERRGNARTGRQV